MPAYDVKWFKHDMPGAPVLTGEPGMLIGVLDACLLNGWGLVSVDSLTFDSNTGEATLTITGGHGFIVDQVILISGANEAEFNGEQRVTWIDSTTVKFNPVHIPQVATASGSVTAKVAPVGDWAKPFSSGDNLRAIYQSSSPDRLSSAGLYLDDSNTAAGWNTNGVNSLVEAYETFTELDTVTGLINTHSNERWFRKCASTSASSIVKPQQWIAVADGQLVYIFINHSTEYYGEFYSGYVFGEIVSYKTNDLYQYIILTGSSGNSTSNSNSSFANMSSSYQRYLQRSYTEIGGSVNANFLGFVATGNRYMGYGQIDGMNSADNGLYLADRVYVTEGATSSPIIRGEMPGLGYPLHREAPLLTGVPVSLPWRGGTSRLLPIRIPYTGNTGYTPSQMAQCVIDISGSWRV